MSAPVPAVSIVIPCRNEAGAHRSLCKIPPGARLPGGGPRGDCGRRRVRGWNARCPGTAGAGRCAREDGREPGPDRLYRFECRDWRCPRPDCYPRGRAHRVRARLCEPVCGRPPGDRRRQRRRTLGGQRKGADRVRLLPRHFSRDLPSAGLAGTTANYEGKLDTVYLGCWPREVFERIGLFDEELVRNQDDEFNLRLARAGGKIWQSPRIKSWYSPRGSLGDLFRQQMQYGYWKVRVIQKHRMPASVRHLVPGVVCSLGGRAAGLVSPGRRLPDGPGSRWSGLIRFLILQPQRWLPRAMDGNSFLSFLLCSPATISAMAAASFGGSGIS